MASEQLGQDCDAQSGDAQRFSAFLEKAALSCLVIEQADDRAELRFTGPFEGRDVVWHCEFVTLDAELNKLAQEGSEAPKGLRNFIEIGELEPGGVPLRVGLALPRIDTTAIEKLILMIRLYKNLRRGRHEYGEIVSPSPSPRSVQDR
jgi:hypothetical protein